LYAGLAAMQTKRIDAARNELPAVDEKEKRTHSRRAELVALSARIAGGDGRKIGRLSDSCEGILFQASQRCDFGSVADPVSARRAAGAASNRGRAGQRTGKNARHHGELIRAQSWL